MWTKYYLSVTIPINALLQFFCLLMCAMLHKVVLTSCSVDKIQIKTIAQFFSSGVFIMVQKVALTFHSLDEYYSVPFNESYVAALSCGFVYNA